MTFDMTNTAFAETCERAELPTEGELLALMVALVLTSWCSSPESRDRMLVLSEENLEPVARLFEWPLAGLVGEIGSARDYQAKLRKFIGLKVRVGDAENPIFY